MSQFARDFGIAGDDATITMTTTSVNFRAHQPSMKADIFQNACGSALASTWGKVKSGLISNPLTNPAQGALVQNCNLP